MGYSVSRHSEPCRKRNLLGRRLGRLRGAILRDDNRDHVMNAAERVRQVLLAVIKARRALIKEYPDRDPDGRQAQNLIREEVRLSSLTAEVIATEYGVAE